MLWRQEIEMDYEKAYKNSYDEYLKYKSLYLEEALEKETKLILQDFGGEYISVEQYEDIILPFWKKYNKKPKKFWFDVFGARDKIVEPRFLPTDLYFNEVLTYLNNLPMRFAVADKCTYDFRMNDIKKPKTICKCTAGFYYDANMNIITREEAIKKCLSYDGMMIIKPSIYSSKSRNVHIIDPTMANEKDIDTLFKNIGMYFIVQQMIEQHIELSNLNKDATNIIRVSSLLLENGDVYIPHMVLRIGGPNQKVVGQGSGGWECEIKRDGSLNKKMLALNTKFYKDEAGNECVSSEIKWQPTIEKARLESGYKIPSIDKLCIAVKVAHKQLPHFRWIGWDFTIDIEGNPILIEYNLAPGFRGSQLDACKPIFGEKTEEIYDECYLHQRFKIDSSKWI